MTDYTGNTLNLSRLPDVTSTNGSSSSHDLGYAKVPMLRGGELLTDVTNARKFVAQHGAAIRYCAL